MKNISTFLVLFVSSVFIGCSTDEYYEVFEEKTAYTATEKAEIYALAEKYGLEVEPMEQNPNQTLKNISELEEVFKSIVKRNNTKVPLIKTKDGTYQTKCLKFSKRTKSGSEASTFEWMMIAEDSYYYVDSDVTISYRNINTLQLNVEFKNSLIHFKKWYQPSETVEINPSNELKMMVSGGFTFDFDFSILYENEEYFTGRAYGEVTEMHKYITFMQNSFRIYGF